MLRTRNRPIVAGRMKRSHALVFGTLLSAAGFTELWYGTNPLAAALGLFTLLSYLFLYTPLKRRSPVCTIIGAVPGAMPPVIGYAAAGRGLDAGALALLLILFVWQFPHFDAIAWIYREDYARGGIRMLPVIEPDGESTVIRVVICSVLLIPISLIPCFLGMTGALYATAAVVAGLGMLYFGAQLARKRTIAGARAVLLASVSTSPRSSPLCYWTGARLDRTRQRFVLSRRCVLNPSMHRTRSSTPSQCRPGKGAEAGWVKSQKGNCLSK